MQGKKIRKYGARKWTSIQAHLANIHNTDQDAGKESQPTTRNKGHVFRKEAWNQHNPAKRTTRFDNEFEPQQFEQLETDILADGISTNLRWIQHPKPHISLDINQTRAKLNKFTRNQKNFQIKKEEWRQNEKTKTIVHSTFVNLPNTFDRSWTYSYPQLVVPFRALKFIKTNELQQCIDHF